MFKEYLKLTKPGIIAGNLVTALGGFLFASDFGFNPSLLLSMILGLSFVIAAGCTFNNYLDVQIDKMMSRTQDRALVQGKISSKSAILFGFILLTIGCMCLGWGTNMLSLGVALTGFIVYVFLYTPIKKRSVHGTLVGSVAGAVPPVVGYCSVSGRIDVAACLLFLIVALWQMPHFYAITLYKLSDYSAANIPVHPLARGIESTKKQMLFYTLCFGVASILPTLLGFKGMIYISVAAACSIFWLALAFQGLKTSSHDIWAKKMFKASLVIIMTLSAAISL